MKYFSVIKFSAVVFSSDSSHLGFDLLIWFIFFSRFLPQYRTVAYHSNTTCLWWSFNTTRLQNSRFTKLGANEQAIQTRWNTVEAWKMLDCLAQANGPIHVYFIIHVTQHLPCWDFTNLHFVLNSCSLKKCSYISHFKFRSLSKHLVFDSKPLGVSPDAIDILKCTPTCLVNCNIHQRKTKICWMAIKIKMGLIALFPGSSLKEA